MPVTVLDFASVTDIEGTDILYVIRGTGSDRDKKAVAAAGLMPTSVAKSSVDSIDLDTYKANLSIYADTSGGAFTLTLSNALRDGYKLSVINKGPNDLTLAGSFIDVLEDGNILELYSDGSVLYKNEVAVIKNFATNFSIDQKEDTEATEYNNQQVLQCIPFGFKQGFDTIDHEQTRLTKVEAVLVPADSHEVTYTGTWTNADGAAYKFGRVKNTATIDDTAVFDFTGVSVAIAIVTATASYGIMLTELSKDNGVTWEQEKIVSLINTISSAQNVLYDLYSGLECGDYKVRITNKYIANTLQICYFSYTTYMVQSSISQYYPQATAVKDLDDLAPCTSLFTGTWTALNSTSSPYWNSIESDTTTDTASVEFRFKGNKIWAFLNQATGRDADIDVYIDGVQTEVLAATINVDAPNNSESYKVRLDDGTLSDDWHDVKLIKNGGAEIFLISGWGFYSETQDSTVTRSLICGKNSYAVGTDDSGFSFTGTWTTGANEPASFLRRRSSTGTQNDYVTFTTPNNSELKAIYMFGVLATANAEIKTQLAGGLDRHLDQKTSNYVQYNTIKLLYDKDKDGDLHNKELRIINNDAAGSIFIEGLIFEIGTPVENNSIFCMPKWTRYNTSTDAQTPVSTSLHLDVYGEKTDLSPGRLPSVHSGLVYAGASTAIYYRHGLGLIGPNDFSCQIYQNSAPVPRNDGLSDIGYIENIDMTSNNDNGLLGKGTNYGSAAWWKFVLNLNRVI